MDDLVLEHHHRRILAGAARPGPLPPARPAPRGARGDRGEGVISAAIAVLIMAFLGVGVWLGFRATLDNTQEKVDNQVEEIGR